MTTSSSEQIDWGNWAIRLAAYIIDAIIIAIPAGIIYLILRIFVAFTGAAFFAVGLFIVFDFLWGIIQVLYFVYLDVYWGGTIGKKFLGLRVQQVNGAAVPFDKSVIRNISKIFWVFLILDWLIGILTPGDKRQKFMDRVAGTIVVQAPGIPGPPPPAQTPPS